MKQNKSRKFLSALMTAASQLVSRVGLSGRLGNQTFEGHRKLYSVFGYPVTISFDEMYSTYRREDIAKRLVDFPARESWKKVPEIRDGEMFKEAKTDTPFVKDWKALVKKLKIYHYLYRVDKLTGVGQFGALFLGAKDGQQDFKEPVGIVSDLLYLQPYMQSSVEILKYDEDTQSANFGKPLLYSVNFAKTDANKSTSSTSLTLTKKSVHYTRVIHVAEDLDEDDIHGAPRLELVYNRLLDVQKAAGSSAESYWLTVNRGMQIDVRDDYNLDAQAESDLEDEIEEYIHGLRRIIRTSGVDITELGSGSVDPRGIIWSLIALIAGAVGWPQRILIGSERGELASTTDQALWAGVVSARQEQFCGPAILCPLIDWCIKYKVVSVPQSGEYVIDWPSVYEESDLEKANVFKAEMSALKSGTQKPVGEVVTEDEARSQVTWAEGTWEDAAKEQYGDDFFDEPEEEPMEITGTDEVTETETTDAGDQAIPETQSIHNHGIHDYELVDIRCPLEGCSSRYARLYPGHNGLLVCHECEKTFDPEIEIKTIGLEDIAVGG